MRALRDLASLTLRHGLALAGAVTRRTDRCLSAQRGHAAILMYHRVLPDTMDADGIEAGMYVRASVFDRQLRWLRSRWRVQTLGATLASPPAAASAPVVVVTFDDGWRDNLTVAWPILERHGLRATVFVVRDWIAAGRSGAREFMTPDEVGRLAAEGMEIGAHSATHPRLTELDDREAEREMRLSKEAVEAWTGKPCAVFAYPYGAHADRTADLAREIFDASVIVGGGWWRPGADPARLPRIGIHQDMSSTRWLLETRLASAAAVGAARDAG